MNNIQQPHACLIWWYTLKQRPETSVNVFRIPSKVNQAGNPLIICYQPTMFQGCGSYNLRDILLTRYS